MISIGVAKSFLTNMSILITCAYLFNLTYKYMFAQASVVVRQGFTVFIFIISGWLAMMFGFRMNETAIFDLRSVPIIFGALVFRDPRVLLVIGTGIALCRFAVNGVHTAAFTGAVNIALLGIAAACLVVWFRDKDWSFRNKAVAAIVVIHSLHVLVISLNGTLPARVYLTEVAVITYPLGMLLSTLFIFIIRDFFKEQKRSDDMRKMNEILRRQTRQLREAKRELEEKAKQLALNSKYKSEFMFNMSHELKTPLNSIILLSQMIRETEDYGTDNMQYAGLIETSSNELLQLINDILDISSIEAGKLEIVTVTVPVEEQADLLYTQFHPAAVKKGLAFTVHIDKTVPPIILSDGLRLNQILRNLLDNAFKFTDRGAVALGISLESGTPEADPAGFKSARTGAFQNMRGPLKGQLDHDSQEVAGRGLFRLAARTKGKNPRVSRTRDIKNKAPARQHDWIVFTVLDTGIGIDSDKHSIIFETFHQGDGSINRQYGGTGLGLSISLQLAGLLGGSLTLDSIPGKGSMFQLRLPAGGLEAGTFEDVQEYEAVRMAD
ncbi:sensor histidine kinase [Paenibacillus sambharensis]|uniref:histidine kinase n=1 Tax=Paenibacillus sambharensis TaxID=1803190 RepID=A0A2W1L887_9BACL|nr:ATP-binding protein [Paenibacillus sambharensis]PZD95466.1 sensor histidine kinase [Paenibacillus sambharensis]